MIKKYWIDGVFLVVILGLAYIEFFHHLGEFTIRLWDEGRNGLNALEMIETKNLIVTFADGKPDLWNLKPPLHIWMVAIFFKILGVSELSLRLPSAISAILTVLIIYFFGSKVLRSRWTGLLGSLVILSSMGFPDIHIGRTGDYDAMLVLWVLLGSLMFFMYSQTYKRRWFYLSGLFWTAAVLTKGMAGIFMFPGIVLYMIFTGKLLKTIKDKQFWITMVTFVFICGIYYLARELLNNGYLKEVWNREIIGRYLQPTDTINTNFLYYWKYLTEFRFQKWIYFVPFSILAYFLAKNNTEKEFVLFAYLLSISYFLIISLSKTKQLWYDAQLYPFMSLLTAIIIMELIKKLPMILRIFPTLILLYYMQRYIRTNIAFIHRPDLDKNNECISYGYFFRENEVDRGVVGVDSSFCEPFKFYLKKKGLKEKRYDELEVGDVVITCETATKNKIMKKFTTLTIKKDNVCLVEKLVVLGE